MSCSTPIVNCGIVSQPINVNPIILVIPCNFFADCRFTVLPTTVTYIVIFYPILIIYDNLSSQVADKRK